MQTAAASELVATNSQDLNSVRTAGLRSLVLLLVVLGVVVVLALALRRSITRPLKEVSGGARMLSRGDLAVDVQYAGRDEIGDVAAAFRDLRVTTDGLARETLAMNTAIVEDRLDYRADEQAFEGSWAQMLAAMNDTMAAFEQSQNRRREAEGQVEDFFDLSPDILCIAGDDGYFKRLSRAAEMVLGYSAEELLRDLLSSSSTQMTALRFVEIPVFLRATTSPTTRFATFVATGLCAGWSGMPGRRRSRASDTRWVGMLLKVDRRGTSRRHSGEWPLWWRRAKHRRWCSRQWPSKSAFCSTQMTH